LGLTILVAMSTIAELTRLHLDLSPFEIAHLQHLVAEWELIADLYFSDLLLLVPTGDGARQFVVVAHVRPTNSETTYREDPVGQIFSAAQRPLVARAWKSGEIVRGQTLVTGFAEPLRTITVPVRREGQVIAVLARDSWEHARRRPTALDAAYADAAGELTRMIAEGTFPYRSGGPVMTETIRAGDGLMSLDADLRVRYVSPNAISALHRLGVFGSVEGRSFRKIGVSDTAIRSAVATALPVSDEIEKGDVSILMLALPLLRKGKSRGAVVLVRDVSELRRRDRLLLSKDAAIREIHHRVKNNLQTIASLLQLQARRTELREAKVALEESVRRIRSIALVHELLSREAAGWLPFNSVLVPLLRDVEDGLVGERRIRFEVEGDAGILPAELATPLAVVLTELLQNAVEHGFPDHSGCAAGNGGWVKVAMGRENGTMRVVVTDNGVGFDSEAHADPDAESGLGMKIVRALITSELSGEFELGNNEDGGAKISFSFPVPYSPAVEAVEVTRS
jgi:two-component sensor histidine kinase